MARSRRSLLLGICLYLCFATVLAQNAFPDKETFLRAAMWRASVIEDYIYLDGGEVSQEGNMDFRPSNSINSTLSIDCSVSWSPETVDIREIERPRSMPVLSQQAIFTDRNSESFYLWGGYLPFVETADFSLFWRFTVDGKGGGQWDSEAPDNQQVFASIDRAENTAYKSTSDGGFVFGGKILDEDGKVTSSQESVKGFKTFNFTTKEWAEESGGAYSQDGSIWGGSATFVDKFGTKGVIVMLGGLSRPDQPGSGYIDWGTIHVYDVAAKQWHSQKASGDVPSRRSHHCAVGVADTGENNSYEIFVYGGGNRDQRTDYGTIYALSLPGFTWTKVNDEEGRNRTDHVCANIRGNSQLISLGGINFQNLRRFEWESKDPYPHGLAIFDMNSLSWANSYDAGADQYVTHEDIRSWYDQGGLDSMNWSDDEIRTLFTTEPGDGGSSSTPVGAIAGGVVGGVVALAVLGFAVWFFRRRRRAPASSPQAMEMDSTTMKSPPPKYGGELDPSSSRAELATSRMAGNPVPIELDGSAR